MREEPLALDQAVSRRAFVVHVGAAAALFWGPGCRRSRRPASPVPGKDRLIVRSPRPINLETPLRELTADVTPTDLFFVRNNYDGPVIDPAAYVLTVDGEVENPLTLRLDDLKRMEMVTQTITLECAGNGRSFHKPPAPGLQWENGAIGTAVWRGVRLADVLRLARPKAPALHVVPDGNDAPPTPQAPDFIRSHPIAKAMEPHTMLALEMNGQPVPHLHGGPVRLLVPGWVGSASIKWLTRLTLADKEWGGPFMAAELPVAARRRPESDVLAPVPRVQVARRGAEPTGHSWSPGPQTVSGFAWAGEGTIVAVDVSIDGGQTWQPARLTGAESRYAWRRWELAWTAPAGAHTLMARASDSLGRHQPASRPRDPQGYRWNVIHAIRVNVA